MIMLFNATFNNISVIPWQSVIVVEETGMSGENHRPVANHWQTYHSSHNVVSSTPRLSEIRTHNFRADRHWLQKVVVNSTTLWPRPPWYFIYLVYVIKHNAKTDTFISVINMYLYFGLVFFSHDNYTRKRIMLKKHK